MNKSELAHLMLDWEQAQRRADELAKAVKDAVLEAGETVVAGNVRASYSGGRKVYDYEKAGEAAAGKPDLVALYTRTSIDWRSLVLDGLKIKQDDVPCTVGPPSVTLKIET